MWFDSVSGRMGIQRGLGRTPSPSDSCVEGREFLVTAQNLKHTHHGRQAIMHATRAPDLAVLPVRRARIFQYKNESDPHPLFKYRVKTNLNRATSKDVLNYVGYLHWSGASAVWLSIIASPGISNMGTIHTSNTIAHETPRSKNMQLNVPSCSGPCSPPPPSSFPPYPAG